MPSSESAGPDYSFEPFLRELPDDWYAGDDLLRCLLARRIGDGDAGRSSGTAAKEDRDPAKEGRDPAAETGGAVAEAAERPPPAVDEELSRWGREAAGRLRELAETSARPENRPRLRRFDAHGRRVDEIVLPGSTREALDVVEGREGLGAVDDDPFVHYAKVYLYAQNGEGGVACSVACTDGLVRALEALGDRPEHRRAAERVRGSEPGGVVHGAQFVTEIQGGSDVGANRTRAVRDGDARRLYGQKWFCSNINADYYLVTARPEEAPGEEPPVGLYLVPARLEGERRRNGHTVDRLKEKLGTCELATAEATFDGALAWPVGPEERGMANLLRHVLVPSRIGCVGFCASALRRAERIARAYASFRTTFGRPIDEYPQVDRTLEALSRERARSLAALFRLLDWWEDARAGPAAESGAGAPDRDRRGAGESGSDPGDRDATGTGGEVSPALAFRVMLSLSKAVLTRRTTLLLRRAAMVLGGNGVVEDFSPLPRLLRDAAIMETWEGPPDVLLAQARRDLRRFGPDPEAFARSVAGERAGEAGAALARALGEGDGPGAVFAFEEVAGRLVDGLGDRVLDECGAGPG